MSQKTERERERVSENYLAKALKSEVYWEDVFSTWYLFRKYLLRSIPNSKYVTLQDTHTHENFKKFI